MALCVHLCGEVGIFLIADVVAIGEECHRFDGESEDGRRALLVEPIHKALLQPVERFPLGTRTIGEVEFSEEGLKIVAVVVADVPEDALEVSRSGGLIDGVDDLFETVGDNFIEGALAEASVHHFIGTKMIVVAILFGEEITHIHQKFHRGNRAAQHGTHDENHVDKSSAERFEVGGGGGVATDALGAVEQPRVHRDGGTVVGEGSFVVLVDVVLLEQIEVAVGRFAAIHLLNFVAQKASIEAYEISFGDFTNQCGKVLVFDIGVGIKL